MAEKELSYDVKIKIQAILANFTFVNKEEAAKFKCLVCGDVAIYHYTAICDHVFCAKCHGKYHKKQCPVLNCTNASINELRPGLEFELGINKLLVHCSNQSNGCTEEFTLIDVLEHVAKCKFSTKKLLPKLWLPPKKSKFDEMIEQKLITLSKTVDEIKDYQNKFLENDLNRRIDAFETEFKQSQIQMESTKTKLEELSNSFEEKLKETTTKLRSDLLIDATRKLTEILDNKMQGMNKDVSEEISEKLNIEKSNLEDMMKSTITGQAKETESTIATSTEELINNMKDKLTAMLDEKSDATSIQLKENFNTITKDITSMKTVNEASLDKKLEQHKTTFEKLNTTLETKMTEKCKSMLDDSKQGQLKIVQEVEEKIGNFKDYILGEQIAQFNWKIPGINEIMKIWQSGVKHEILSEEFHSVVYGNMLQCKLKNDGMSNLSMEVSSQSYCQNTTRIYLYQSTISILDQSGNEYKRDIGQLCIPKFGGTFALVPEGIPIKFLKGNSCYIKDDCIVLKVVIAPFSLLYKSVNSRNGTLVWTLENYTKNKKDMDEGIKTWVQSPYMYTSERGYLVHLELSIGKSLTTVLLSFDKGEYDDKLGAEFPHTTTVTILNQSDENKENSTIEISKKTNETSSYPIGYLPLKNLEQPTYLMNDKIEIKFEVK